MFVHIDPSSTRAYLIRALHEWCTDNGLTPYIAVQVDAHVQVPQEYVQNNEIVLNISFHATSALKLGNDYIEFKARFGGQAREIIVPIKRVMAIYAKENGQGMAFPIQSEASSDEADTMTHESGKKDSEATGNTGKGRHIMQLVSPSTAAATSFEEQGPPPEKPPGGQRASLKRVK